MKKYILALAFFFMATPAYACGCQTAVVAAGSGGVGAAAFFAPLMGLIATAPEWIGWHNPVCGEGDKNCTFEWHDQHRNGGTE